MIDFEKEFSEFTDSGQGGSSVKEIYNLIPTLTQEQLEIYMQLNYFINEYKLEGLRETLITFMSMQKKNKNLSFIRNTTLKNLMKAYTQEELIRGIKVQRMNNPEDM